MFRAARSLLGKTMLIMEHNNQKLSPASLSAVTAAHKLGHPLTAVVAGKGSAAVVSETAKLAGVQSVLAVDSAEYANGCPESFTTLIMALLKESPYTHVVAPHTAFGKGLIPRVAALNDSSPLSDVIGIKCPDTFIRPTYAGNAISIVTSKDAVKFLTVRATGFEKAAAGGAADAPVTQVAACGDSGLSHWKSDEVDTSGKPELTSAKVVISGGRGLKNGENFKLLYDFADALGNTAVGATRAVVDAGYVPNELQVGQTGKVVAPQLYIAVGLSGAIQHLAGMKDSKVIAAINTDPEAPIFTIADYSLQADLFDAVPKMTELIAKK